MVNGGRAMDEQQYFLADVYDNNGFLLAAKGNSANKSLIERLDNKNIKYKVGSFDDLRANSVKKSKVETKPDPKLSTSRFFEPIKIISDVSNINNKLNIDKEIIAINNKKTFRKSMDNFDEHTTARDLNYNIQSVINRLPALESELISLSSKVVAAIINRSKEEKWGMHLNVLANNIDYIYDHSINVSIIAIALASKLQLAKRTIYNTALAALLHDIGMVLLPQDILQSKEKLSMVDRKLVNQHPALAVRILKNAGLPEIISESILQHHEKIDGTGYPLGLTGDKILIEAKIIKIASSFDSHTSEKPYRKAQSVYEVIQMMWDKAGKEFDKETLAAFMTLISKDIFD